ncbi:hypothetical protein WJX72_000924 [[Myrmecia] bisecta]|uniref:Uncharacterized protein n=1 Tax=[Myrmecia] bisecta TaxID=41462 RepID=A0AAW1QE18_9CHLO
MFRSLQRASEASEVSAKQMDKAALELEKTMILIQANLPSTLVAVERTTQEFEQLGSNLNEISGGLTRRSNKSKNKDGKGEARGPNPVQAVQTSASDGMRRVAQDVSALTAALTPAMDQWRKRITGIAARLAHTDTPVKPQKQLPATAVGLAAGHDMHQPARPEASKGSSGGSLRSQPEEAASAKPEAAGDTVAAASAPTSPPAISSPFAAATALRSDAASAGNAGEHSTTASSSTAGGTASAGGASERLLGAIQDAARQASSDPAFATTSSSSHDDPDSIMRSSTGADTVYTSAAETLRATQRDLKGAQAFNQAAESAEEIAARSDALVAAMAANAKNGANVKAVFKRSASGRELALTPAEQLLLEQLKGRREAAEAIFNAISRAESAAARAAQASGALADAMQEAEVQGVFDVPQDEDGMGASMQTTSEDGADELVVSNGPQPPQPHAVFVAEAGPSSNGSNGHAAATRGKGEFAYRK